MCICGGMGDSFRECLRCQFIGLDRLQSCDKNRIFPCHTLHIISMSLDKGICEHYILHFCDVLLHDLLHTGHYPDKPSNHLVSVSIQKV